MADESKDKGKQPASLAPTTSTSAMDEDQAEEEQEWDQQQDADGQAEDDEEEEEDAMQVDRQAQNTEQVLKKDKSLAELLVMMDDYAPIVPDAVTDYYLARAGFESEDVRLKRLLALASQKFIADIATDALQWSKIRQQQQTTSKAKTNPKDKKAVLTMEDLTNALADHGVNLRKPEYFAS
ncbi:hypothetical protein SmJEL517_g03128 [Synchytrium microbalum]|uniref:Transcription initiation factor TFIID subunit 10 n=1 Tax=Synchytrium microbalum TaxID=1806994 RepID=A0A507BZI4_9FUNG|nr:uncharacterized protein SmJEL517_g03128 [Synchytrium microbalum]TPX34217.1 hypothetical protein SmJEL517_g03128 [Synchytrium microbalum]